MKYSDASDVIFRKKNFETRPIKKFLNNLYIGARDLNDSQIIQLVDEKKGGKIIDLGCDDGKLTMYFAQKMNTKNIWGVDINSQRLKLAKKAGVRTIKADLNKKFPLKDNFFDAVVTNQVIEHVTSLDNFVEEIYRVLKPGGYAIISTENASSWCNIFASILGWQIFSLTNFSKKKWGLGNPLALHESDVGEFSEWTHKTILNISGLRALLEVYNFSIVKVCGSGYFPLPNRLGRIDKTHAHFMTFKVRKKKIKIHYSL